ncbi:MAG TPA: hypothetical protein VH413_01900 [Verrucomicrobiae bacterium]|nr:hypothetical protein [Verrucomicrobiae bacterium]
MACNYKEFFQLYFSELERRGIPCVIIHSYQEYPEKIASDIDYSVPQEHLPGLHLILADLAEKNGWALVQTLQHGVFAYYSVVVNLEDPTQNLRLDACSAYARVRRYFVPETVLLTNRVKYRGFFVPSPAGEFAYVVAKMYDAKNRSPAQYLPRLKQLWSQDKLGAEKNFTDLFGNTGKTVEQWFDCPPDEWRPLGPIMYTRKKFGAALLFREAKRVLKRVMNPTGVSVAILGLDDAARKSLVARLEELLQPCFRYQPLHFRPRGDQSPQNAIANPLKAFFYFLNYLAAWWQVVPARISSHFVVCEGSFDELLINAEQAGTKGEKGFARFLRRLLPRPDQTFILLTPVRLSQQRHPGSAKDEWERQERGLLRLAADQRYYTKISAEESPEELARHIWREVVNGMAVREARRA